MLHSLSLKNFKRHVDLDVDFTDGLTSIVGPNAGGKTSVLKGILFALFGAAAAGAKDHLWKWGADGSKSVGLAITLPTYGRVTITRTPTSAKVLAEDGRVLASGNTAVTRLIEEDMGMIAKDLRTLCYSPQGESQGLLTMGPTAMQQKVEGLAQIETVDKVLGLLSTDISKLSGKLEVLPNEVDPGAVKLQIEETQNALDYFNSEMTTIQDAEGESYAAAVKADAALTQGYKDASASSNMATKLEQAIVQQEATLQELNLIQGRHDACKAANESHEDIDTLTANITTLADAYIKLTKEVTLEQEIIKEVDRLEADIPAWVAASDKHIAAEFELVGIRATLLEADELCRVRNAPYIAGALHITQLRSLLHDTTCPTCKQSLQGTDPEQLQAELVTVQTKLDEDKESLRSAVIAKDLVDKAVKDQERFLNPAVGTYLKQTQDRLAFLSNRVLFDVDSSVQDLICLKAEHDRAVNIRHITNEAAVVFLEVSRQLETQATKLYILSNSITQMSVMKNAIPLVDIDALIVMREATTQKYQQLIQWKQTTHASITEAANKITALNKSLEEALKQQNEYNKANTDKSEAESLQKYLRTNRTRMASDIWGGLLHYASALISNTTGGELTDLNRSTGGDFTINENGRSIPVTESSGAQRSIIGMSLRAALSKIFYGDGLVLILDEVTADCSEETAAAVAGMLASLNMQVVTVSHRVGDSVNSGTILELK